MKCVKFRKYEKNLLCNDAIRINLNKFQSFIKTYGVS